MSELNHTAASDPGIGPGIPDPSGAWRAEANPDRGYGEGGTGEETPQPDLDKDAPGDPPPARGDRDYGEGGTGEETPQPDPDKDAPGDPPGLNVAEKNGR